jgi:rhodanese-related sulfurtransferase
MFKHATVQEAHQLQANGSIYVDVRSVPEFEHGHPEGSFNVPLLHIDPRTGQRYPNQDFVSVMRGSFPADAPLLIGCQAGARSVQACQVLAAQGYTNLTNVLGGWGGSPSGDAGWVPSGLPVERTAEPAREYATLAKNAAQDR